MGIAALFAQPFIERFEAELLGVRNFIRLSTKNVFVLCLLGITAISVGFLLLVVLLLWSVVFISYTHHYVTLQDALTITSIFLLAVVGVVGAFIWWNIKKIDERWREYAVSRGGASDRVVALISSHPFPAMAGAFLVGFSKKEELFIHLKKAASIYTLVSEVAAAVE